MPVPSLRRGKIRPLQVSWIKHSTIWWWGSNSGVYRHVEYLFLAITLKSSLIGVVVPARVSSMDQTELLVLDYNTWNHLIVCKPISSGLLFKNVNDKVFIQNPFVKIGFGIKLPTRVVMPSNQITSPNLFLYAVKTHIIRWYLILITNVELWNWSKI